MVGASRSYLGEPLRVAPADELEDIFRGVIAAQDFVGHLRGTRRERPPKDGQDFGEQSLPPLGRERLDRSAAEGLAAALRYGLGSPVYRLDGAAVALLVRLTPR